jgi:hypothetical protein
MNVQFNGVFFRFIFSLAGVVRFRQGCSIHLDPFFARMMKPEQYEQLACQSDSRGNKNDLRSKDVHKLPDLAACNSQK